jgi:hypothetical protein
VTGSVDQERASVPKSSQRRNDARRANKDRRARLEELRRQQRAAERRKNALFMGAAIVVGLAMVGGAVGLAYEHDQAKNAKAKAGYQAKPTADERAAGCLGVHNDPLSPAAQHVPNAPIDYAKNKYGDTRGGTPPLPPSGGPHNPVPLNDQQRFYALAGKPRPERAVHNLEHGYVVIWYDSKLPADQVAHLQSLAALGNYTRMLVVGWWQGDLPGGKHVVLTSWGRTDRCSTGSDKVISAFYQAHLNASIAPEAGSGVLTGAQFPGDDLNTTSAPPTATATPSPTASKKK